MRDRIAGAVAFGVLIGVCFGVILLRVFFDDRTRMIKTIEATQATCNMAAQVCHDQIDDLDRRLWLCVAKTDLILYRQRMRDSEICANNEKD